MEFDLEEWVQQIRNGNNSFLSRAITFLESTHTEKQRNGRILLRELGKEQKFAWRIAISGVPGVGKSTFVNELGKRFIENGKRVAILAIDPSSQHSGGSILGDKTRMVDLAASDMAYIRPTATSGSLGGVANRTYEAQLCCEAAGYDVILIETVGVGQSETTASELSDLFLFLKIPQTGDELQGMKKGIMELADLIFINKSDAFQKNQVNESLSFLKKSLPFLRDNQKPFKRKVLNGSALNGNGMDATIDLLSEYFTVNQPAIKQLRFAQEIKHKKRYAEGFLLRLFTDFCKTQKIDSPTEMAFDEAEQLVERFLEMQKLR